MKKMPPRYVRYVRSAPLFAEKVEGAGGAPVEESLESFEDDPFLLYSCLWYAYSRGVSVTFRAPSPVRRPSRTR